MSTRCPHFNKTIANLSSPFCEGSWDKNHVLWLDLNSCKRNVTITVAHRTWCMLRMYQSCCSALCYISLTPSHPYEVCPVTVTVFMDEGRPWGQQRRDGSCPRSTAIEQSLDPSLGSVQCPPPYSPSTLDCPMEAFSWYTGRDDVIFPSGNMGENKQ